MTFFNYRVQSIFLFFLLFLNLILVSLFFNSQSVMAHSTIGLNHDDDLRSLHNYNIPVNGSDVYVVWQDDTFGSYDIFFTRSTDNGETFDDAINISNNTGNSYFSRVSSYDNNVYVTWADNTQGNYDIFFTRSTDNGKTFEKAINLSNNTGDSDNSNLLFTRDKIFVTWIQAISEIQNDIFFAQSIDKGKTFSSSINLSNSSTQTSSNRISSYGNNVYIIWDEETFLRIYDIFFTRSTDNGKTFEKAINLSNNTGDSYSHTLASFVNNVYVLGSNNNRHNDDIFFTRSTDNGKTFEKAINLSNNTGDSYYGHLVSSENNVYVIWYDNSPIIGDIYFTRSTDNGKTFEKAINLSNSSGFSYPGRVVSSGNNVYVTWYDNSLDNYDIFFTRSTDNGKTFEKVYKFK